MLATINGTRSAGARPEMIPFLYLDELLYNLLGTDNHKMVVKDRETFLAGEYTPLVFKGSDAYAGVDVRYSKTWRREVSLLRTVNKFEKAIMKPFYRNKPMPTHGELSAASAYGRLHKALKEHHASAL